MEGLMKEQQHKVVTKAYISSGTCSGSQTGLHYSHG
jgi:hypothetical protein